MFVLCVDYDSGLDNIFLKFEHDCLNVVPVAQITFLGYPTREVFVC